MKNSELRIGNFLASKNISDAVRVGTINSNETIKLDFGICKNIFSDTMNLSAFEPIPITEEWLLNFGFRNQNFGWDLGEFGIFDCNYKKGNLNLQINATEIPFIQIKYVHQLQNLYFSLTGFELALVAQAEA